MNTRAVVCVLLLPLFLFTPANAEVNFSKSLLKKSDAWFRSDEARKIADSVLLYQSPQGGWPKNTNLARPRSHRKTSLSRTIISPTASTMKRRRCHCSFSPA